MNIVLNPPTNTRKRMGEEVGKIFVGGVNRDTTIDAFRAYFESFGKISDIVLMMDKETGINKGYGFVKYEDPRCADDVISKKGHHKLDGRELDTKPCNARGSRPRGGPDDNRTKKIFVGGISQQASKDDVYDVFKLFGKVEDVHIMTDNVTGKHRGFGFVTLDSEETVEKLVRMHHLELKGKSMEIKKAQPKLNRGFGGGPGGGPGGPGPMGGGFPQGGGSWNQGGQPGYGGYGGGNQWNMGQPMGQFGQQQQQQQGGFQQRGGPSQGYGGQQQGYSNGYRQQGQGGPGYGQQGGGYGQQQQQPPPPQQQQNYGGGQGYGNYGGYGQAQQDPYGQQPPPPQQYGNQGSMGNYPQEASGYGPQRVNYNQQQGYNQGQFGNDMQGQNYGPPQQQQQQPQPPPQQQPQQGYGQQIEGGPDMYGNNNYGRGNMGGGNQFHPYRRFQGNQVQ